MAIEGYAMAKKYGFGALDYSSSPDETWFAEVISIECGTHHRNFITGMKEITLKRRDYNGTLRDTHIPLYVVLENGRWKEYFTGMELKMIEKPRDFRFSDAYSKRFYCKTKDIDSANDAKAFGCRELTLLGCTSLDAQQFANEIAKYDEYEIKMIVSQLYALEEKARLWGPEFEKAVLNLISEYKKTMDISASVIESKMGAYARNGDVLGEEDKQFNHVDIEKEQKADIEKEQKKEKRTIKKIIAEMGSGELIIHILFFGFFGGIAIIAMLAIIFGIFGIF